MRARRRCWCAAARSTWSGTIELKGAIDFHLADDAQLLISTKREDYHGGLPGSQSGDTMAAALGAVIMADHVQGLKITGTGNIQGRAKEFMTGYDETGGIWKPGPFRPKMFVLTGCKDLEVRDITFAEAPNWGLHLLGCDGVLVDNVKVQKPAGRAQLRRHRSRPLAQRGDHATATLPAATMAW